MAIFLTQPVLYRIIQRELPEDVYPDSGDPAVYWSTADSAAMAQILALAYTRLSEVYDNYWPQYADEDAIAQHEVARYGILSTDLDLQARRDRVLAKMRSLESLSVPDLTGIVEAELPVGTLVRIKEWGCVGDYGSWYIGESELGYSTILSGYGSSLYPIGTDLCAQDGLDVGMTTEQWQAYRQSAYTYDVQIYDYEPTDAELQAIDRALTASEPSESFHTISELQTVMATLDAIPGVTSLHLIADLWDGGAVWEDQSGNGNDAVRVGTPTIDDSQQFYQRLAIAAAVGSGFHAPGDDFDATTQRTYEVLVDDYGAGTQEFLIGRVDAGVTQVANWLYKNFATTIESAVSDATAASRWIGSDTYVTTSIQGLPVMLHVVIDAVARTIKVYRNGTLLSQSNNPLFGSLATPTGLALGIFGRWNQSAFNVQQFTGTIMELARHEVAMDQATITARAAEFNRLKGY